MLPPNTEKGFLKSTPARILSLVLIGQAVITYGMTRHEIVPVNRPLAEVPINFGPWTMSQEGVVYKETQEVLKADYTLTRQYMRSGQILPSHLFVAYFKTQRTGQTPHSPKNCLPGNGWVASVSDFLNIDVAGRPPIQVNRYLVQRGTSKSVVLYWYQSRDRVVASEFHAKFYSIADAIRYNHSDTALVRVIVPVVNDDLDASTKEAVEFVKAFFNPLRQHFPA